MEPSPLLITLGVYISILEMPGHSTNPVGHDDIVWLTKIFIERKYLNGCQHFTGGLSSIIRPWLNPHMYKTVMEGVMKHGAYGNQEIIRKLGQYSMN